MTEIIIQVAGNAAALGIFSYVAKQYVKNIKHRLDSHSGDIKTLNERTTRNEEKLISNKENDANMNEMFEKLLDAKLKPIHDDLVILKNRKP